MGLLLPTKEIQQLLARATVSLNTLDAAVVEAQVFIRNANAAITEARQIVTAIRQGLTALNGDQRPDDLNRGQPHADGG